MLKAVIFDMDGVLIDSEPIHMKSFSLLAEELGIEFNKDYYAQFIGSTTDNMWKILINDYKLPFSKDELMEKSDVHLKKILGTGGYPIMSGASEIIKNLHENGVKLAIASSSGMQRIEDTLNKLGVSDIMDGIVSGMNVKNPKPAPDTFLEAAKILNVSPDECIVVEDSVNGMKAAKNANMICVMYENLSLGKIDSSNADYIIQGFEDLEKNDFDMIYSHLKGEPWRVFETERLYLREQSLDDLDRLYEIYAGEDITKYVEPLYENYDDEYAFAKAYIENMYKFYGYGLWMVCLKENDEIIGRIGLSNRDIDDSMRLELGYIIGKDYQRQGYAYEACKGVLDFVKNKLYVNTVIIVTEKENIASVRLAEKLGFKYVFSAIDNGTEMSVFERYE